MSLWDKNYNSLRISVTECLSGNICYVNIRHWMPISFLNCNRGNSCHQVNEWHYPSLRHGLLFIRYFCPLLPYQGTNQIESSGQYKLLVATVAVRWLQTNLEILLISVGECFPKVFIELASSAFSAIVNITTSPSEKFICVAWSCSPGVWWHSLI